MRRWWCAAAGLGRRVLSSSSAAGHARRPLPPPVVPKAPSFSAPSFSLSCRRHHAPLPQGLLHTATASSFRPPVIGASAAGAALRQEGEIARAAHAYHLQSQEIQAQGPLVHEVQVPNHERRADPQVEGRQAPQCAPQVQGSQTKTSQACIGALSLCKSYKEAQLLRVGNEDRHVGVWHGKQID